MGIVCEINLDKPPDGVFKPGDPVFGNVKYTIKKDTKFKIIKLSLKGVGKCQFRERQKNQKNRNQSKNFNGFHKVLKLEQNILTNPIGAVIAGVYTAPFNFTLPINLPPSFNLKGHRWKASMIYSIKMKFEESNTFSFAKVFETIFTVGNIVYCNIPNQPIMYGTHKNLKKWYGAADGEIILKATLTKPFITPSEYAELHFEVHNKTSLVLPLIKTRLLEIITLTSVDGRKKSVTNKVNGCKVETKEGIASDSISSTFSTVPIPCDLTTIQNSCILTRDYELLITIPVPGLHRDVSLLIPVVIGETRTNNIIIYHQPGPSTASTSDFPLDAPPSYWDSVTNDSMKT